MVDILKKHRSTIYEKALTFTNDMLLDNIEIESNPMIRLVGGEFL